MSELVPSRPAPPRNPPVVQPPRPNQARLLVEWRRQAPWLSPVVAYVAAVQGLDPSSPHGQRIMEAGARQRARKGLGWHSVGDVVSSAADFVTPERVEDLVGTAARHAGAYASEFKDSAMPVVRTGLTGLESLYQTGQGLVRNVAAETHGAVAGAMSGAAAGAAIGAVGGPFAPVSSTAGAVAGGLIGGVLGFFADDEIEGEANWNIHEWSAGGLALEALIRGEEVDLGSGWLPAGEIAEKQRQLNRNVTIGGQGLTPGRLLAGGVLEPGSTAYNVASGVADLAVALGPAEPAAAVLRSVGAVNAARRTVLPGQADAWLSSTNGRLVVDWLAEHSDFDEIWKATGRKFPVKVALKIADTDDADEVADILRRELGVTIRDAPRVQTLPRVRRTMERVRILGEMPGQHLDVNDLDAAMETFDAAQRNARLRPEQIAANNRKLAEAETPADVYRVVVDDFLSSQLREKLTDELGGPVARRMTQAWTDWHADLSKYFVDEIGENVAVPGAVLDAAGKPLPSPHLYVEYLNSAVPLPDARTIRRATSTLGRLASKGPVDVPVATMDWFMQQAWKPMVLLRGAWTLRVVGEEQIRMAASGLTSLAHHPLSHVAMMVGNRGRVGMAGDDILESAQGVAALARGSAGFTGGNRIRTRYKVTYARHADGYAQAWGDELAQLVSDPLAKRVAGGVDWETGDVIAALPDGSPVTATGNHVADVKEWFWAGTGRKLRENLEGWGAPLGTRAASDAYIDSVFRRVQIKTASDPELIGLVATGRLGDVNLIRGPGELDGSIVATLDEMAAEGLGPDKVKGDLWVTANGKPSSKVAEKYDRAVESMFNALMSRPTNWLSRSPAFRQFYWERAAELLPAMDSASQTRALANAARSKAPNLAALRRVVQRGSGDLSLDDADLVAKGFALDETRKLLYDLSKRSQFFDVHRLIFPFGEAWKEILATWARLGVERPQTIRRGQQVVQGLRQWTPEEVGMGMAFGEGHGFFYEDANGREVFAYPGSELLTEKLLGQPVPFTGSVAGLSLATSVLPGVGPVVQMTAGSMLPKTPDWDWVREIVLPFGEKDVDEGFVESHLPAWLQKLRTSGLLRDVPVVGDLLAPTAQQERALAGAAFDLLSWEVSTGRRRRPDSMEAIAAGIDRNMTKARWLYVLRAGAQFGAPSAPTPEMRVVDKSGSLVVINELRNKYREIADREGWANATRVFLDEYGEAAFFAIQPRSRGLAYGLASTTEADEWMRAHSHLKRRFKQTIGLWAPAGVEFDPGAYGRQFDNDERQALTPEQMVMQANARLAGYLYDLARDAAGDSPNARQRELLRALREQLRVEFPGFAAEIPGLADRTDLDSAIDELRRGLTVPELAESDAGQGLRKYLEVRDAAQARAEDLGVTSFRSSQRTEPLRLLLRRAADVILAEHPGFGPMWSEVFSREMTDDTEEIAA